MFKFKNFLEEIRKEKKISNELLSELLKDLTVKNENNGDILYSGYEIKNSIEMFINYVSQLIYKETAYFHIRKGDVNKALAELGLKIENFSSGSYDLEFFKVSDLDGEYFNKKLLSYLCEISSENNTENTFSINDIEENKSIYENYKKIKSDPLNFKRNDQVLVELFSKLSKFEFAFEYSDRLIFSNYKPSDLYESWYINEIFVKKA